MQIYAHRGWHNSSVPENSMAAFHRAASVGYGIETDLRTDQTGRLILFHNRLVGDAPVETLMHAEIERRSGMAVPTLRELLAADLGVPLNLEVKTFAAWSALQPFLDSGLPQQVLISSFIHPIVVEAAETYSQNSAYLVASAPASAELMPCALPLLSSVVWDFNVVDDHVLAAARGRGLRNLVYGAYTCEEHETLLTADCDAVITDTPDVAEEIFA